MAEQTRREILVAARRLFAERGFARTSIADIAGEAGVAPQTIYDRLGSKAGLLVALVDLVDEEVGITDARVRVFGAPTARAMLREFVAVTRAFQERTGDIVAALFGAAAVEPELREASNEGRRRHRLGARRVADRLAELGALRDGVDPPAAAALLSALTMHESWLELVREHGMSWDDAEDRIVTTLSRALLRR